MSEGLSSQEDIAAAVRRRVAEENALRGDAPPGAVGGGQGEIDLDFIRRCYQSNEVGDSILYNTMMRGRFAKNTDMGKEGTWMCYTSPRWEIDRDGQSLSAVEEVAGKYMPLLDEMEELQQRAPDSKEIAAGIKAIIGRIKKLRSAAGRKNCLICAASNTDPLTIHEEDFDQHPMLLPVKNGTVDLRTGELRPARWQDFFTKFAPTEWRGIDVQCPEFDAYLDLILDGDQEKIGFLLRALGYAITGLRDERIIIVLFGERGQNGKGTLVDLLYHILGALAGPIQSETLLVQKMQRSASGPSPDIMAFKGLRIACAEETEDGAKFAAGKVKWLTGGTALVGRRPNDRDNTMFLPTHTLFLLTNSKPHAPAQDNAFWERMRIINFPFTFVNREPKESWERRADPKLFDKLKAEAPGILAKLVRSCLEYQRTGLATPKVIMDELNDYRTDEDTINEFIEELCELQDNFDEDFKVLYGKYKEWWEDVSSGRPLTRKKFGSMLKLRFESTKSSGRVLYHGLRIRMWQQSP